MTTTVGSRIHGRISLGFLVYLVIGAIVAISQDYWNFTEWDGHELASFLTALMATLLWPIAIFYSIGLTPR